MGLGAFLCAITGIGSILRSSKHLGDLPDCLIQIICHEYRLPQLFQHLLDPLRDDRPVRSQHLDQLLQVPFGNASL